MSEQRRESPKPFPDITDAYALENDWGALKLYQFINGVVVEPDAYDDLARVRGQAVEIARRALEYVAKCDSVQESLGSSGGGEKP